MEKLSPQLLIRAYCAGVFPMARSQDDPEILWFSPEERGVIPLDAFHIPRSLKKTVRQNRFDVHCDRAFAAVMEHCAGLHRGETWINAEIHQNYWALHDLGCAHSVECWREGKLVGGLYGVSLGGAFFGESMFSLERDASKVALVHLVARLRRNSFALLDTQFVTGHLQRFGTREISRDAYLKILNEALAIPTAFYSGAFDSKLSEALAALLTQSTTQTS